MIPSFDNDAMLVVMFEAFQTLLVFQFISLSFLMTLYPFIYTLILFSTAGPTGEGGLEKRLSLYTSTQQSITSQMDDCSF